MKSLLRISAFCALAASLAPLSAKAEVITADLDVISKSKIGTLAVSLGTVTVTDIVGGVMLDVSLLLGSKFVDTGGPHTAFTFNLDLAPTSIAITAPGPNYRVDSHGAHITLFTVLSGSQSATPYGSYSNGIDCPGCGPGASHAYGGPLDLTIMGVSVSNFVANANGYFFAADVIGPKGGTGSIAADDITTIVPEPSTWAMMLIGFAGLAFTRYRRRRSPQLA